MKIHKFKIFFLILLSISVFGTWCSVLDIYAQDIKYPNVAGSFYPDNPDDLSQMIDEFLKEANPEEIKGNILGLISPHAGYGYSGQTAAYGYKLILGRDYKTVIIIGPSHFYGFRGVSVYPEGIFRTPLGDLEIDKEFAKQLLDKDPEIFFDAGAFQREHSVEVQLPFLQKALPNFSAEGGSASGGKIVPLVMGDCEIATCRKLAHLLKEAIGNRSDVLIIVSTDMYHGYDYQEAEVIDRLTLSYLEKFDTEGLYSGLREARLQLCGGLPAVSALILAGELGHNKLKVLKYTNSAFVTGKKNKGIWTVGYASCVIDGERSRRIDQEKGAQVMLNREERKKLLKIARESIEYYLKTGEKPEITEEDPVLLKEMGVFVTLHKNRELRGCIGNLIATQPLYLGVRDMAIESAVGDPRFSPVEPEELKDIEIEISALTPLERIDDPGKIELGKHGVLVRKGFNSGVFLPQVATETGWSKEEFLSNLCAHKAGLAPDAWKDKNTEIYIFSAEVFSEE